MSVDLAAPEIAHAYEQIKAKQLSWLLLTYGQTRDKLFLFGSGSGGVEELVAALPDNDVFFGFCREEEKDRAYFCLISYVPEKTNALVAARALVHSRSVAANFKAHHAIMSAARRDDITTRAVRAKLRLDAQPRQRHMSPFDSTPDLLDSPPQPLPPQPSRIPVRSDTLPALPTGLHARAATETPRRVSDSSVLQQHSRLGTSPLASARPESPSMAPPRALSPVTKHDALPPPPPPPKELPAEPDRRSWISFDAMSNGHSNGHYGSEPPSPTTTIPTIPDDGHSLYAREPQGRPSFALSAESAYSQSTSTLHTDFAHRQQQRLPPVPVLPRGVSLPRKSLEERQRDIEERRERERREVEELARREREEQEERRRARAEQLKREEEEEENRRQHEEQERRRWVAERQRKAEQRRLEEERKQREEEERKAVERARRIEDARRLAQKRAEEERAEAEARALREQARLDEERRAREHLKTIAVQFVAEAGDAVALSGECTVQTSWSTTWRRRYFELSNDTMTFYKHEADPQPLDVLRIKGRVRRIAYWKDGYDELQSIPHSFAVEFKDDEGPWFFYTDSNAAKDVLVGLLSKACGLL